MFVKLLIAFSAVCVTFSANAALVVNQEASSAMNRDVYNKIHSVVEAVCAESVGNDDPLTLITEETDRRLTVSLGPDNYIWEVSAKDSTGMGIIQVDNTSRQNRRTVGSAEKYVATCNGTPVEVEVTKVQ